MREEEEEEEEEEKTYLTRVGEKLVALQSIRRRALLGLLVKGNVIDRRCRIQSLASL